MRRRNNDPEEGEAGGRRGPQDYPERDPLDLIEEDKRPFARRKLLATCCGGYRTVYDEVTAQSLHPGLHVLQILIYCFLPVLIIIGAFIVFKDFDQRFAAAWFVAGITFVVCGAL